MEQATNLYHEYGRTRESRQSHDKFSSFTPREWRQGSRIDHNDYQDATYLMNVTNYVVTSLSFEVAPKGNQSFVGEARSALHVIAYEKVYSIFGRIRTVFMVWIGHQSSTSPSKYVL